MRVAFVIAALAGLVGASALARAPAAGAAGTTGGDATAPDAGHARAASGVRHPAPARPAGAPRPFSHDVHVGNFEVGCSDCHRQPATGAPQLSREGCADCHEVSVPGYVAAETPRLSPVFPHATHARALPCLDCHRAVLDDARVRGQPVMPRLACPTCHTRLGLNKVERRCEACHEGNQRRTLPRSHGGGWLDAHPQAADGVGLADHGGDCALCHGSDACIRCHRERRPRSHTGLWTVRTHGLAAGFDREGCKACHETGVCVRCHQTTPPMNHTGAWAARHGLAAAATDNEHCRACHTVTQCTACHRSGL